MNPEEQSQTEAPQETVQPTGEVAQPAPATPQGMMEGYNSNPFRAFASGLSALLERNPVTIMTLGLLAPLMVAAVVLVGVLLAILIGLASQTAGVIVYLLFVILAIPVAVLALGASLVMLLSEREIIARQAIAQAASAEYWKLLGAAILSGIVTGLASILLIVPGIIVGARLSLFGLVVYDEKLGPVDAMKRSWALTKGHTWEMIGVNIANIVTMGNGGLLGFVGARSGLLDRYKQLKAAEATNQSTGETHWMNYVLTVIAAVFVIGYIGVFIAVIATAQNGIQQRAREAADQQQQLYNNSGYRSYDNSTLPYDSNVTDPYSNNSYY